VGLPQFFFICCQWMTGNLDDAGFMAASANELVGRTDAITAFLAEELLYDPVFQ